MLGVFAGDFDLAAAAAVVGLDEFEVLDLVEQLMDKSMLEADPSRDRYRLLETMRQYAWDRLIATGRLSDVRDAHTDYFMTLAGEQAATMGVSGRQLEALDRLEVDYDNLRAALAHLIEEHRGEEAARMVRRLSGLFNIRHPREGHGWFRQVITLSDNLPAKNRARLLGDGAFAAMSSGDSAAQAQYAQAAIDAGGSDAPAVAHWLLGQWFWMNNDAPRALEHNQYAVTAATATRDVTTQITATGTLVAILGWLGSEDEARRHIAQLIDLAEHLGNPTLTASTYLNCGRAFGFLACPDEAITMFERGLVHADAGGPITAAHLRSELAAVVEDPLEAMALARVAIQIAKDQLGGYQQVLPLLPAVRLMAENGKAELAGRLLGNYEQNTKYFDYYRSSHKWYDGLVDQLTQSLGADRLEEELRRGAQLTVVQGCQLALDAIDGLAQSL